MTEKSSYRRIGAVDTAFEILEHLSGKDGQTGREIANELRLPYGTVMSHLATLCDRGYVAQSGGEFRIGSRMAVFWASVRARLEKQYGLIGQILSAIGELDKA